MKLTGAQTELYYDKFNGLSAVEYIHKCITEFTILTPGEHEIIKLIGLGKARPKMNLNKQNEDNVNKNCGSVNKKAEIDNILDGLNDEQKKILVSLYKNCSYANCCREFNLDMQKLMNKMTPIYRGFEKIVKLPGQKKCEALIKFLKEHDCFGVKPITIEEAKPMPGELKLRYDIANEISAPISPEDFILELKARIAYTEGQIKLNHQKAHQTELEHKRLEGSLSAYSELLIFLNGER